MLGLLMLVSFQVVFAGTNDPYNLSLLENRTNLYQFTDSINDLTGGYYVAGFITLTLIVLFSVMKGFGVKDAFAAASFPTAMIAILLWTADLTSDTIMIIFVLFAALGGVLLYVRGQT